MPARIRDAAGVWYDEFSNLTSPLPLRSVPGSGLVLPDDAAATRWADGLQTSGAQVLAEYEHPHFGRWPAITTAAHERGRITYVGTVPNPALGRALFDWLSASTGGPVWPGTPEDVTVTTGVGQAGRRVHFVHHWAWGEATVRVPRALRDVLSDATFAPGDALALGPWDVRVLVET
jgi:beta-galactosidase